MSIGAGIASALGMIAASAINAGASYAGMMGSLSENSALMKLQAKLNKQSYEYQALQGPALVRKGLTSAGYNPILPFVSSAGNNLTNATYAGTGLNSNGGDFGLGNSISNGINAGLNAYKAFKLEKEQNEASIRNLDSTAKLNEEKAKTEESVRDLNSSLTTLHSLQSIAQDKENNWIDRKNATAISTSLMNALSNRGQMQAQLLNAKTAKDAYELDKNYRRTQSTIDFYNAQTNRYKNNFNTGLGTGFSKYNIFNDRGPIYDASNFTEHLKHWK